MRGTLSPSEDYYRTLQVDPSADLDAIHAAYRRLARLYHPDLNPRPEAAERMRAINDAYRVLSDSRLRASYDARRFLRASPTGTLVRTAPRPQTRPRPVVVASDDAGPSPLQKRVDRVVAVIGVLLLVVLGIYSVFVIPRAEQQFQNALHGGHQSVAPAVARDAPVSPGSVPDRLRTDPGLRSFPGMVLVPPSSLAPFKDLPLLRLDETGQGIARYAVYYGDLTTGVASISGLIGRASFDSAVPRLPDCAPEATYCAGPGAGQTGSDPPGLELFRLDHLVGDNPAFVTHRVCCNGVYWSLSWYEPATNMSYTIDLSRNVAMQFGNSTADDDQAAARVVAALAGQLVPLP